eukprot:9983-Heterococcus_DN1.PRE.6
MSTKISNITAVEFNATAFNSAVIDVTAAVVPAPALPSLQVVITKDPLVNVATTTKSKRRRLQAVANSVTVAYDVRNLPDGPTATALERRLTSADGDTSLLNSYNTLSDTPATAATTIKTPAAPPVQTATAAAPIGIIAGIVVGGVAVLVAAAALAVCCNKRRVAARRRELLRKAVANDRAAALHSSYSNSSNSSSSKRSNSGSSFTCGSTSTAAARDPLRHRSARNSESMLQAIDSDSASEHNATAVSHAAGYATDDIEQGVYAPVATVGNSKQQQRQQQQQALPTSANSSTITSHSSSASGAGGTVRFAVAPAAAATAVTATATAGSAAVNQRQLATKQAWTRRLSTRVTSAARHGIREHGEKAVVAWEGIGSVAEHIPWVKHAYGEFQTIVTEAHETLHHVIQRLAINLCWTVYMYRVQAIVTRHCHVTDATY